MIMITDVIHRMLLNSKGRENSNFLSCHLGYFVRKFTVHAMIHCIHYNNRTGCFQKWEDRLISNFKTKTGKQVTNTAIVN